MSQKRKIPRGLYAITDCERLRGEALLAATERILEAGAAMLQYREKSRDHARRKREAPALRALCRRHGCLFIVNDDVALAQAVNSDGAHLGKDDLDCQQARAVLGDEAIIGVSCYDQLARAAAAETSGADYVAFGAFHPTAAKPGAPVPRPALIGAAKAAVSLPVAAIGGMSPDNCAPLLQQGADLIAAMSGLYQAEDPRAVAAAFNKQIHGTP